ncbi:hypothetical protein [Desulfovibrio sp. JC010]|uniref:hypothetical protein n=1 Tax=Desulfovibrio sp. JC010 TaxID=2593641 RepID=UPI0013D4D20D|nr:hypothetical protein [Desulfovibrio sp. JC010]NDV28622.1 hypothetical protein [Desulfovibrio sp. JC010]
MLQMLSTFGLGALTVAVVQFFMTIYRDKKTLQFQEKKDAYLGLLEAYHLAAVKPSPEAAKNFALWQMRCELVGNEEVVKSIQEIVDTNEDYAKRSLAHEKMKKAMRKDLKVA